jgi:hypothetical protein
VHIEEWHVRLQVGKDLACQSRPFQPLSIIVSSSLARSEYLREKVVVEMIRILFPEFVLFVDYLVFFNLLLGRHPESVEVQEEDSGWFLRCAELRVLAKAA